MSACWCQRASTNGVISVPPGVVIVDHGRIWTVSDCPQLESVLWGILTAFQPLIGNLGDGKGVWPILGTQPHMKKLLKRKPIKQKTEDSSIIIRPHHISADWITWSICVCDCVFVCLLVTFMSLQKNDWTNQVTQVGQGSVSC